MPITLNFSAQTSSFRTQEILEVKLEKRKKTLLGAPIGKRVVLFVDDVNMPKLERYGAQPPIELLRFLLPHFSTILFTILLIGNSWIMVVCMIVKNSSGKESSMW